MPLSHSSSWVERRVRPVCGLLLLAAWAGQSLAEESAPFRVTIGVSPPRVAPGENGRIAATITIAPGYFLYAKRTSMTAESVDGVTFGRLSKPKGETKQDPFIGSAEVYKKQVRLSLPFQAKADAAAGPRNAAVRLEYQGCSASVCFPPAKLERRVRLVVAAAPTPAEATPARTNEKPERFRVTATVEPRRAAPGDRITVKVTIHIAPKHHLYVKQTSVEPLPTPGVRFGPVKAPPGEVKQDPYLGRVEIYEREAVFQAPATIEATAPPGAMKLQARVKYMGCSETTCFPPAEKLVTAKLEVATGAKKRAESAGAAAPSTSSQADRFTRAAERFGVAGVMALAFLAGVAMSLTPCVYPIIPVTVAVIGASSAGSKLRGFLFSLVYVLGLSLTYAALGAAAATSGALFGSFANHPAVRITVAVIFGVLALSMFDVFYIQMPPSIQSKLSGRKGAGVVGVFITGLASGLVVGPCVGPPLVGLLLYVANLGDQVAGFFIMWSFALGMGLLFLALGTFSGLAASLPKAGRWMEWVKYTFGVLLAAAALYFVKPLFSPGAFCAFVCSLLVLAGVALFLKARREPADSPPRRRMIMASGVILVAGVVVGLWPGIQRNLRRAAPTGPRIHWLTNEA